MAPLLALVFSYFYSFFHVDPGGNGFPNPTVETFGFSFPLGEMGNCALSGVWL